MQTREADRQLLLQIAREAITAQVTGVVVGERPASDTLDQPGAVFVSIHRHGQLRGCMGHLDRDQPLGRVVFSCAVAACSADPRFPPVTTDELAALEIEVSLLGPFEPISAVDDIEVGRHGLLVERDWRRGLLLPQVATEWRWDRETFLAQTCHKAGLPRDAWKQGAKVWRFEAEVFGESSFTTNDTTDTTEET